MILIDIPIWAAHGTVFAHLVSDASFEELHDFAARVGVPRGAFDGGPLRRPGAPVCRVRGRRGDSRDGRGACPPG